MKITELSLPGVFKLIPKIYRDDRGFFVEIYNPDMFKQLGITTDFVQDSTSYSKKNILRGMHFQIPPHIQDKLVRCDKGKVYDIVADINPNSETYGEYVGVELSEDDKCMLFIPGRYAHGFCVLGDDAVVEYKLGDTYHPNLAGGVMYNDPVLNIDWPVKEPIMSEKDMHWKPLPLKNSIT